MPAHVSSDMRYLMFNVGHYCAEVHFLSSKPLLLSALTDGTLARWQEGEHSESLAQTASAALLEIHGIFIQTPGRLEVT